MTSDPEINVQDVNGAARVRAWILRRVRKLASRHPDITRLRVAVETPHRRRSKGRRYRVQIGIGLPGSELVLHNHPEASSEKLIPALHDAFHRSERRLDERRASRRRDRRRGRSLRQTVPVATGPTIESDSV
ncbi:MAG: hypothetical protein CSA75_03665 [Sorangium cellulosum]|nr:MAG: hypothetical protein CSA75_03665 [Sorangium cellulosum]